MGAISGSYPIKSDWMALWASHCALFLQHSLPLSHQIWQYSLPHTHQIWLNDPLGKSLCTSPAAQSDPIPSNLFEWPFGQVTVHFPCSTISSLSHQIWLNDSLGKSLCTFPAAQSPPIPSKLIEWPFGQAAVHFPCSTISPYPIKADWMTFRASRCALSLQ